MSEVNLNSKSLLTKPVGSVGHDIVQLHRDASGKIAHSEVARSFEQIFIQQLVKEMSSSLDKGFFGDTEGSQVYQGLFETFLAQKMTDNGGIGLASMVEKAIQQRVELTAKNGATNPEVTK